MNTTHHNFAGLGLLDDAQAVGGILSDVWNSVSHLFTNPYDPKRKAQNETAFRQACAGDVHSVNFLRARSGRFGLVPITVRLTYAVSPKTGELETPGTLGRWATDGPTQQAGILLDEYDALKAAGGVRPSGLPGVFDDAQRAAANIPSWLGTLAVAGFLFAVVTRKPSRGRAPSTRRRRRAR